MHTSSSLSGAIAADRERALRKRARTAWQRPRHGALQIRAATDADAAGLVRLARLDSSRPPSGTILVAEDDGKILAAMSVEDGASIADPFHPTASIVSMLRIRAEQLRDDAAPSRRRPALRSLRRLRPGASTA
jgi:hypothetical protein